MNYLQVLEHQNQRILTTQQLADSYETDSQVITNNYNRNKDRYIEGKHYYALEGAEKQEFLNLTQFDLGSLKNAKTLYLWTEKGTFLHAKSLNTDKAWEAYDNLIDFYFHVKETGNLVSINELERKKVEASLSRAKAMEMNAKTRQTSLIFKAMKDKLLSPIAAELFGITTLEGLTNQEISYRPQLQERHYTATEIAEEAGVSANMVGKIANANDLKTEEYGIQVLDKSPYSPKQVPAFRYNEKGRARLLELLEKKVAQ